MATDRRQVHIDFHTPPDVRGVARLFDAKAFARRLEDLGTGAATIFARCHYGMCYYPTEVGIQHPGLAGRDLLGETIEALAERKIRSLIYTTVGWDEDLAGKHPDWRQVRKDGSLAVTMMPDPSGNGASPRWRFLNWLHPGYAEFLDAHVRELLDRYPLDGLFFDILFLDANACWSEVSMGIREEYGYLEDNWETHRRFELLVQRKFTAHTSELIRESKPDCSIFYNTPFRAPATSLNGMRTRLRDVTHWEIESLASGPWGFAHFEPVARFLEQEGKPWAGMTSRFLKSWGDFGGLKPAPELEFESFRAQGLGGGMIVGDQMKPDGSLDAAAWETIGSVFNQLRRAEPFYEESVFRPRVGVISADNLKIGESESQPSTEGALELLNELGYDAALIDDAHPFEAFELVVAPDSVLVDRPLCFRLQQYFESGGKLILSGRTGENAYGEQYLMLLPGIQQGLESIAPTYWRARQPIEGLAALDAVIYESGIRFIPGENAEVWIDRVYPEETDGFFSHAQGPPACDPSGFPAAVRAERLIWFGDPIFREWRRHANPAIKPVFASALEQLIGPPVVTTDLGPAVRIYPRRRGNDLLLTLLHYPRRRIAESRDVIDARGRFSGGLLKISRAPDGVRLFQGEKLKQRESGEFQLPDHHGRLLLEVPGFYESS